MSFAALERFKAACRRVDALEARMGEEPETVVEGFTPKRYTVYKKIGSNERPVAFGLEFGHASTFVATAKCRVVKVEKPNDVGDPQFEMPSFYFGEEQ